MNKQLQDKDREVELNEKYAELLADLFQKGIIDEHANFIDESNKF